jgi:transposase
MKKGTTRKTNPEHSDEQPRATRVQIRERAAKERLTVGLDLGDRNSSYCVLDEQGEILLEATLPTSSAGLGQVFAGIQRCRIALEVGTHSPWVSRQLTSMGHEVIVGNSREVAYITRSTRKNDRLDARKLARLARADVELLSPIRHRSEAAQVDLAVLRMRDLAVRQRSQAIVAVRGMVKSLGERLKACAPEAAGAALVSESREEIRRFAKPYLELIEKLNETIRGYDQQVVEMEKRYPEVKLLKQVYGVGSLIALTFILTVDDAHRFRHSRDIGPFLGLRPKKRDSGKSQPELGISKEGDKTLRWLLVQGAHTILRRGAPDSDLRRWGLSLQAQSEAEKKKNGSRRGVKKKAVVAVARKLAVLMHHLWVSGEVYDPMYQLHQPVAAAA